MTNIEIKTKNIYDSLNNSERKVATYFLANIDNIFTMPISQLAKESGVSQVTWIRFCKAIGFDGLKDLKKALFSEINSQSATTSEIMNFSDVNSYQNVEEICNAIKNTTIEAIEDTFKMIEYEKLSTVADLIINSKNIYLFGVGASGILADDLYQKLIRIKKNAFFNRDIHMQLIYASTMSEKDIAIIFSYSGKTKDMLDILKIAKENHTPTVAVTKYNKSELMQNVDYALYVSTPEISHRSAAMSSRIAQCAMIDVLFSLIANKDYKKVKKYLEKSYTTCIEHSK